MKLRTKMNYRFIYNFLLTDVIKLSMKTYCIKCRKNTENLNSKIFKTKNGRLIMQSKCPMCRIKKSRFMKEKEANSLLRNLGIKTPLSQIPLLNVLSVKMNEIVNKFLLVGDKFMPEMHLKQPGFIYSTCGPFTKNREFKSLCTQETLILLTKMNLTRLVFNMIWLVANQKI